MKKRPTTFVQKKEKTQLNSPEERQFFLGFPFIGFIVCLFLLSTFIGGRYFLSKNDIHRDVENKYSIEENSSTVKEIPTLHNSQDSRLSTPSATVKPSLTVTPTKTINPVTITPTLTKISVTPTVVRTINPPQISIFTPTEGQIITYANNNNSDRICVGDGPAGGDTSGIQRRYMINGSALTSYQPLGPLCFTAIEGVNTIQTQYKNQFGEESQVYLRNFVFQK